MGQVAKVREAFGFLHPGEVQELQRLVSRLPNESVVVNIGAGYGTSGLAFIEARGDIILYTVDIQAASHPHGSLENERNTFREAGYLHLLDHAWFQVHGDSAVVGRAWRDNLFPTVDLLFIDGNHEYSGAAADILAWLPHVVHGGYIAVHDYQRHLHDPTEHGRRHPYPGVDKAVRDHLITPGFPIESQIETMIVFRKQGGVS